MRSAAQAALPCAAQAALPRQLTLACACGAHRTLTQPCAARQVLPTQLIPDEKEGKVLRVRMIQKEGVKFFNPAYLFDEGSTISWSPCGRKLTCSFPGIKFYYGPDTYFGEEARAAPAPAPCSCSRGAAAGRALRPRAVGAAGRQRRLQQQPRASSAKYGSCKLSRLASIPARQPCR